MNSGLDELTAVLYVLNIEIGLSANKVGVVADTGGKMGGLSRINGSRVAKQFLVGVKVVISGLSGPAVPFSRNSFDHMPGFSSAGSDDTDGSGFRLEVWL